METFSATTMEEMQMESFSFLQVLTTRLSNPFKNTLIPASLLKLRLKSSRSPLVEEFFNRPGGWQAMEIIYENKPAVDLVDSIALKNHPVVIDARNRRKAVVSILNQWILQTTPASECQILGVGSGPALEILDAISDENKERVSVTAVDLDSSAFEHGRSAAIERGLGDSVQFIEADARNLTSRFEESRFDFASLIGIIEYLTDSEVGELLSSIREVLVAEGRILTHGFQDPYQTQKFFRRVFGMELIQRSESDVIKIFESNGFNAECLYTTPLKTYPLIAAQKR